MRLQLLASAILLLCNCLFLCCSNSKKNTADEVSTVNQGNSDTARIKLKKANDSVLISIKVDSSTNKVEGDFNGDGKKEFAWLVAPKIIEEKMECVGDCNSIIQFSDTTIAAIIVKQCIGGEPVNLGDLNNNGSDEIGLSPDWFTSCWSAYYVYTLKNKKWGYAVEPFSTHCNQWDNGVIPIEKDLHKKGNVLIRYSKLTEDSIVTITKSIPIK